MAPYLALAFAVSPLFAARLAPAMDVPAHLALVAVMRGLLSHDLAIAREFEWGVLIAPNTLFHALSLLLSYSMPLTRAGVVLVGGAVLLCVVGFTELAATFGRSRFVAVALVPFSVQWALVEGLVDYMLGIGLMACALSTGVRFVENGGRRLAAFTVVLSGLVFFAHVQATLTYACCCMLLSLLPIRRERGALFRAVTRFAVLAGLPLSLGLLWRFRSAELLDRFTSTGIASFANEDQRFTEIFSKGPFVFSNHDQGLLIAFGVGALLAGRFLHERFASVRGPVLDAGPVSGTDTYLWGVLTGAFAGIAFAPISFGHYWHIGVRAIAIVWWLFVVLLVPRAAESAPLLVRASRYSLLLCAAFVSHGLFAGAIARWNAATVGLLPVLERAPHGSRLIMVRSGFVDDGFTSDLDAHIFQYHTVLNYGTSTFSFGYYPGRIVRQIDAPQMPQWVGSSDLRTFGDYGCFDYVFSRERLSDEGLHRIAESGRFSLYRFHNGCPRDIVTFRGGGGDQGTPEPSFCDAHERPRGLLVTTGARVERAQALCTSSTRAPNGRTLECAEGERFVGIAGAFRQALTRIEVLCARGTEVRRVGAGEAMPGDAPFQQRCPAGTEAGMVRTRTDTEVRRVEIGCVPFARTGAGG